MSDNNDHEVLVPASAAKWIALVGGILVPIALGVIVANVYSGSEDQTVQVYPLPEE
ncbi:hypothetical protein RGUI_1553 [Rhodovulum sp. P5]|uniref:hypothetical protein n=1 Tax=Rhodovulum sp. P5 TaxID=1564506 RepID=UPI0009C24047|nr:hypothetical protein [Rhodovulum sp. P5]ARE39694.1 hypothetical protein RGUI_1553 [Rhodovulum sp. P5]